MHDSPSSEFARPCALALAATASVILIAKLSVSSTEHGSVSSGLAHLSQFFTILTNVLVAITMTLVGLNRRLPRGFVETVVVAIVCVGGIYHLLLGHLSSHQGFSLLVNQGLHSLVPALTLLWWLLFADKCGVAWSDSLKVILWPLIYVIYIVTRAQWSDFYPYHFIDLEQLGVARFSLNLFGLASVFYVFGLALISIARYRCKNRTVPK